MANNSQRGKLFIVSAPSGSGKTTLVEATLEKLKNKYLLERIITYTTRPARIGEKNGQDYHFITPEEFEAKIAQNFFLEWSTDYHYYYGTPKNISLLMERGISCIVIVDIKGAETLLQKVERAVSIWIAVRDTTLLYDRLRSRLSDGDTVIAERMRLAVQELADERVQRLYRYTLVNNDLAIAIEQLCSIIENELDKSLTT